MLSKLILKKYPDEKDRAKVGKVSGITGVICNFALFVLKLLSGIFLKSVSVIADAVNNLSDASSNVVTYFGFKLASRPADKEHPYGHGRYEYLSALLIAVIIVAIGAQLLSSSIKKLITPTPTQFSWIVIGVLIFSIALKLWMFFFYRSLAKGINSETLKAASKDSLNDVVATLAILVAAIISYYTSVDLDGYMGIAVALFIFYSGFSIIKETVDPLLGKAPSKERTEKIKERILSYDGVLGTHDLLLHDYGPGRQFASVHVEMSEERNLVACHEIIDKIERDFFNEEGLRLVIHLDPTGADEDEIKNIVKEIDENLTVHDLRTERDGCKVKYLFDCVIPENADGEKLIAEIKKAIEEKHPDSECEITADSGFVEISK